MSESDYSRITYDTAIRLAQKLASLNPQMTFIYVAGALTDSSEKGRVMWASVKRKTHGIRNSSRFRQAGGIEGSTWPTRVANKYRTKGAIANAQLTQKSSQGNGKPDSQRFFRSRRPTTRRLGKNRTDQIGRGLRS
jgi:hypothetical protein